jgi:hypothetical protein
MRGILPDAAYAQVTIERADVRVVRSDYLSKVPLVFFLAFVSAAIGLGVSRAFLVGMGAMGATLGLGVHGPIALRADMRRGIRALEDYLRAHVTG